MTVLKDDRGRTVATRGANQDITELKEAELALRLSEERFRTLVAAAFEGIAITEAGIVVDASDRLLAMLGYAREDVLGQPVTLFVAPEDRARVSRHQESDSEQAYEHLLRRQDGSIFPVEARGRLLQLGTRRLRLTALRDITERRQMEDQRLEFERRLHHAQRLESLGTLAGGVAHDFNNILAAIFGNLALARMDIPPGHPAQGVLAEISQLSERARDLVRQILAFSRPESHQRANVALEPIVMETARMVRAMVPRSVEITTEISDGVPAVHADATQIHQVIVNLCTNAWQAIGDQPGRITIGLARAEVTAPVPAAEAGPDAGVYAVVSVRDTGSGMDPETIARLFEPFFTTKRPGHGTGLGLAVVHGIVAAHGGTVRVISRPGEGSRFEVHLPETRHEPTPAPPVATDAIPSGVEAARILLVDDEVSVAKVCSLLLRRRGHHVTACHIPEAALETFRQQPENFDLVITDMSMPGMSGMDLATSLHAIRPDLPVILATGFMAALTETSARARGISALVQKPVEPAELAAVVERVLAERSPI
jgi:PAS domain S-box-containing protein